MAFGDPVSNEVFLWILLVLMNYILIMNYGKAIGFRRLVGATMMMGILPISFLIIDTTFNELNNINVIPMAFTIIGIIYFFFQLRIYIKQAFKI